ncbi:hypothetical protein CF651_08035 [Paenibacillus rigui]|uniref:Uncharacterized protein n=1 Tax=Paenibacillus rigui TaxID=554312 RepID=A0A229UTV6_9BACL|nr:hypothetical protein CF651_08035 [Paenibacillus rigui]
MAHGQNWKKSLISYVSKKKMLPVFLWEKHKAMALYFHNESDLSKGIGRIVSNSTRARRIIFDAKILISD